MTAATAIRLVIPSEVRLVDLVHEASQKMAELAGFAPDEALNVGLAVREATINAITHGNATDPSRRVDVTVEVREDGSLQAKVRDEGAGFDPGGIVDPTREDNVLNTSGRGLLMIRAFVDEVEFQLQEGRGLEVTLTKFRPEKVGRTAKEKRDESDSTPH